MEGMISNSPDNMEDGVFFLPELPLPPVPTTREILAGAWSALRNNRDVVASCGPDIEARFGQLDKTLRGRNAEDDRKTLNAILGDKRMSSAWVVEIDAPTFTAALTPCGDRFSKGYNSEDGPLTFERTRVRDPLARTPVLVVAPRGNGGPEDFDALVVAALLDSYASCPSDEKRALRDALVLWGSPESGRLAATLDRPLPAKERLDEVRDNPAMVAAFREFLDWSRENSPSPVFSTKGYLGKFSITGFPPGFFSALTSLAKAEDSGFAALDFVPQGRRDRGMDLAEAADRSISALSSADRIRMGEERMLAMAELNAGSADFLTLVRGGGVATRNAGEGASTPPPVRDLLESLGPEFRDEKPSDLEAVLAAIGRLQEDLGGDPNKRGSLVDFTNFLIRNKPASLGMVDWEEDEGNTSLLGKLEECLETVKRQDQTPLERVENRDALCAVVARCVWEMLPPSDRLGMKPGETVRLLTGLVSNGDKTEHTYVMWRYPSATIKQGKAKDVMLRAEDLSREGGLMIPVVSYPEKNIPVGDWSVSLLEAAVNGGEIFRSITGAEPALSKQEERKRKLRDFLGVFGTTLTTCPGSFADMIVAGVENRLESVGDSPSGRPQTLDTLLGETFSTPGKREKELSAILKGCPKQMIPLISDFLRSRHAMTGSSAEKGAPPVTPEALRKSISSMVVAAVAHCGGTLQGREPGWAASVAEQAEKDGSGVLGGLGTEDRNKRDEMRGVVYRHRRQYGPLNTEKILHREGVPCRQGKTEMFSCLGLGLGSYVERLDRKLPPYLSPRRQTYIDPLKVERTARMASKGGMEKSYPRVSPGLIGPFVEGLGEDKGTAVKKSAQTKKSAVIPSNPPSQKTKTTPSPVSPARMGAVLSELLGRGCSRLSDKLDEIASVLGGARTPDLGRILSEKLGGAPLSGLKYAPADPVLLPKIIESLGEMSPRPALPTAALAIACAGKQDRKQSRNAACDALVSSPSFAAAPQVRHALRLAMGSEGYFPPYPVSGSDEKKGAWLKGVGENPNSEFVIRPKPFPSPPTMRIAKDDLLAAAKEIDSAWRREKTPERSALELYAVSVEGKKPTEWHESKKDDAAPARPCPSSPLPRLAARSKEGLHR